MVESNKIAPTTTIQDLQGVNILGSWTSATSSMVGERPEPKDKIILFNFFQLSATEVVEWWYNEAAFHDYHSESQNSRSGKLEQRDELPMRLVSICSGNFSQMIWSASKALGVGYGR